MSKNFAHLSLRKSADPKLMQALIESKGEAIALKRLAQTTLVGEAHLLGAATSYDFIMGENANKRAYVCNGSSCLCAGTQPEVEEKLYAALGEGQVGHVTCLGRCHENAAFSLDGENYSGRDIEALQAILDGGYRSAEDYVVKSLLKAPILTAEVTDLDAFYGSFPSLLKQADQAALLQQIIDSGLRGRGGAGFPTGVKWQSCAAQGDSLKYVVCNADEGDPGAFSDRYLLEQNPHQVLYGMWVAAYLAGARYGILYIRDEYPQAVTQVQRAIEAFEGLSCRHLFEFDFRIVRGAGAYICGEETALLRSLEGQKPMVSVRPPFPTQEGLFAKPTVVNNVETFAAVHWILNQGADAYAALGTSQSTGTKLVSLDSFVEHPGIYEVEMGTPLSVIIEAAGGLAKPVKALHIGGPLGGLVPYPQFAELPLSFEAFAEAGFLLGHASVVGIPESQSLGEYLYHLFAFTSAESCGKCFPCRLGAKRGEEMFAYAIKGERPIDPSLLRDLLTTMKEGSLCALGGGVPLPIENALTYFSDELKPLFKPAEQILSIEEVSS